MLFSSHKMSKYHKGEFKGKGECKLFGILIEEHFEFDLYIRKILKYGYSTLKISREKNKCVLHIRHINI